MDRGSNQFGIYCGSLLLGFGNVLDFMGPGKIEIPNGKFSYMELFGRVLLNVHADVHAAFRNVSGQDEAKQLTLRLDDNVGKSDPAKGS